MGLDIPASGLFSPSFLFSIDNEISFRAISNIPDEKVNLIMTSPPFALNEKKPREHQ